MRKHISLLLFLTFGCILPSEAQELRCNVMIDAEQVQTQERQIFDGMQKSVSQFINSRKWTEDEFLEAERIKCNLQITLKKESDVSSGVYEALAQIQYSRPVHNTNYESPVLSYVDNKFNFRYKPNEPLIFRENANNDNLTSMLAFYAYIILSLDYDTFSEKGGDPYLEQALNVLNNSQSNLSLSGSELQGWDNSDIRNRYWLSENLNSPQFVSVREGLYRYHRHGLDLYLDEPEEARTEMLGFLRQIKRTLDVKPNSLAVTAFFDAKSEEIYNIFEDEARPEKRKEASDLLLAIDPAHSNLYRKLTR